LKDLGFEEKWGFEIWLNDLNTFLEKFEI